MNAIRQITDGMKLQGIEHAYFASERIEACTDILICMNDKSFLYGLMIKETFFEPAHSTGRKKT